MLKVLVHWMHIPATVCLFQSMRKSLQRELLTLNRVHRNIVTFYGLATRPGLAYLAMELCQANLKQFRKGRILIKEEVSVIEKEILVALEFLHSKKVIHRLVSISTAAEPLLNFPFFKLMVFLREF